MAKEAQRKTAEQLYLGGFVKTRKELAERVGVAEATVRSWIERGNWEQRRQATQVSKENIEALSYQIAETYQRQLKRKVENEEQITDGDINSLHKLSSALKNIAGQGSFRDITQMVSDFMEWLKHRDLALAQQLLPYVDEYLVERAEELKQ
jgi:transposase